MRKNAINKARQKAKNLNESTLPAWVYEFSYSTSKI
jgi:hypothetical protein